MNQIKVEVIELKFFKSLEKSRTDSFRSQIGAPELGSDENVFPFESGVNSGFYCAADFWLDSVFRGGVYVTVSCFYDCC